MQLWRHGVDVVKELHPLALRKRDYPGWFRWACFNQMKGRKSRAESSLKKELCCGKQLQLLSKSLHPCTWPTPWIPNMPSQTSESCRSTPHDKPLQVNLLLVLCLWLKLGCIHPSALAICPPPDIWLSSPHLSFPIPPWKNILYIPSSSFSWSHSGRHSLEKSISNWMKEGKGISQKIYKKYPWTCTMVRGQSWKWWQYE